MIDHFTVRIYGIYINDKNQVLLSDEYMFGKYLSKFPGGGLEFNEGIHDCLKREWIEELDTKIEIKSHFYTNDFFIRSVFVPSAQVISIYYFVDILGKLNVNVSNKIYDFTEVKEGSQSFRFADLNNLDLSQITLDTDKKVCELLVDRLKKSQN